MLFLPYLANSVRQRVNSLRNKYQTVYNAEFDFCFIVSGSERTFTFRVSWNTLPTLAR